MEDGEIFEKAEPEALPEELGDEELSEAAGGVDWKDPADSRKVAETRITGHVCRRCGGKNIRQCLYTAGVGMKSLYRCGDCSYQSWALEDFKPKTNP